MKKKPRKNNKIIPNSNLWPNFERFNDSISDIVAFYKKKFMQNHMKKVEPNPTVESSIIFVLRC